MKCVSLRGPLNKFFLLHTHSDPACELIHPGLALHMFDQEEHEIMQDSGPSGLELKNLAFR